MTDREGQPRGRRGRIGDRLAASDPALARFVDLHRDRFVGRRPPFDRQRDVTRHRRRQLLPDRPDGAILVEKTDRLYRNIKDWMTVDDLDVTIDFVKENAVVSKESRSSYTFLHGIKVTYRKPFDLFARATETGEWRGPQRADFARWGAMAGCLGRLSELSGWWRIARAQGLRERRRVNGSALYRPRVLQGFSWPPGHGVSLRDRR